MPIDETGFPTGDCPSLGSNMCQSSDRGISAPRVFYMPLERVKVTSEANFWRVVKRARQEARLLAAPDANDTARGAPGGPLQGKLVANLNNTIVMMPRFFLQVRRASQNVALERKQELPHKTQFDTFRKHAL
jgi:hypothetical protein